MIAQRGETDFMLLTEGQRNALRTAKVRVFARATGYLGPEMPAVSVFARGYWEELGADVDTAAVIAEAEAALSLVAS